MSVCEILSKAAEREAHLAACADLYEEVTGFMAELVSRTYDAYNAARGTPEFEPLRRKHLQALRIRDDYRGFTRENREDAELLAALRQAARKASDQSKEGGE